MFSPSVHFTTKELNINKVTNDVEVPEVDQSRKPESDRAESLHIQIDEVIVTPLPGMSLISKESESV